MAYFIATLAPERYENWDVCKREGLWGVVGRGSNWRSNGTRVQAGDRIFIWRGGTPNGFIAELEALGPMQLAPEPGVQVPWDEPDWFGGVIPMRVVSELEAPVADSFTNATGRVGARFGFNNTVLQHIFEEVPSEVAARVAGVFPATSPRVGQPFSAASPPKPVMTGQPFDVDPDAVDRGLNAHHQTVQLLAEWVARRGWEPRLPRPDEPQYDLAWEVGGIVNVAEIKSTTDSNREMQLRLGLGQVLRYRQRLTDCGRDVMAWLVAEQPVLDHSWMSTCAGVGVSLTWPSALR